MRLTAFGGKGKREAPARARTTVPGSVNSNRQEVVERTGYPSATFPGQVIYRMRCRVCTGEYGANGCDVHARRCPACQGGAPGEALRERPAGLFG